MTATQVAVGHIGATNIAATHIAVGHIALWCIAVSCIGVSCIVATHLVAIPGGLAQARVDAAGGATGGAVDDAADGAADGDGGGDGGGVANGVADGAPASTGGSLPLIRLRIDDLAAWTAQPSWVGNPAGAIETGRGPEGVLFRVLDPGLGMKWSRRLPEPASLAGARHVAVRYRASGAARSGDYLLAILGGLPGAAESYRTPILPDVLRADGRWRTASGALGDAAGALGDAAGAPGGASGGSGAAPGAWELRGIAVQVQAGGGPAEIEVAEVRFLADVPLVPFAELLPFERAEAASGTIRSEATIDDDAGGTPSREAPFRTVDIAPLANADASMLREALRVRDWLPPGDIVACGVPFAVLGGAPEGRTSLATGLEEGHGADASVSVPLSGRARAVALLLVARLEGNEEPSLGSGELREVRDVDRLAFRLRYEAGPADEMMALSEPEGRFAVLGGPQVSVLFADPDRDLSALDVIDRSAQMDIHVLAATLVATRETAFEARRPGRRAGHASGQGARQASGKPAGASPALAPSWGVVSRDVVSWDVVSAPGSRLLGIRVGGEGIDAGTWYVRDALAASEAVPPANGAPAATETAEAATDGADLRTVRKQVVLDAGESRVTLRSEALVEARRIRWRCTLENEGPTPVELEVLAPDLVDVVVRDPATDVLFYPKRGAVLTAKACSHARPGSGLFPVQILDLSAAEGGGVSVRTEDLGGLDKTYEASKGSGGARLAVRILVRVAPGETIALPDSVLELHAGDWHAAFEAYRRWLASWRRPREPLKPWFREIFNFRQRFLWFWDPLYDRATGRFRVREALEECREAFGGLEYLHLMDWGSHPQHGRTYGRPGDPEPWDAWKGGPESLAEAIREAGRAGIPVGLYVEGYLLEERGPLGSGAGKGWQIRGADGKGLYWPGASEMFICPWVAAWRDVQVETYRRLLGMFPARGFYIDQLGFADLGKTCWADGHGHPVPARPLRGEVGLTRRVSEALGAIDPVVAIYTEETPADLANGFQDGSFTYAMHEAWRTETDVPLNIGRFAFPDLKTFEILVCDQPTGSWATGVLWTFFNGEGIWLEGPAREWFRPRTLAAIRKAHAILREHREAFTTLAPEPLVPTAAEGIFANRFPGPRETVTTLWNARPITYRGPVLTLDAREGTSGDGRAREGGRVRDAWNDVTPLVRVQDDGRSIEVHAELAPYGVGCIVVER